MIDPRAGPMTDLTEAEAQLVSGVIAGRRVDLKGETIRASTLRTLVTEARSDWTLQPIGVLLDNAVIQGSLDLEGCTVSKPLVFQHCKFSPIEIERGAMLLRDSRLKRLAIYKSTLTGTIFADRCNIESAFFLSESELNGGLRLRGAFIGEALALDKVRINKSRDVAILSDGLHLGGPWILRNAVIAGAVRFAGSRIGGSLLWEEAEIKNGESAIVAEGAICEGSWILRRGRITGPIRLRGMTVQSIDAQLITITAGSDAFNAKGAQVTSDVVFDGATVNGGILLGRANIAGEFSAKGSRISGPNLTWAVAGNGVSIGQGIGLSSSKLTGGLMLAGARIGQGITASNIEITSAGRAIEADVMHVAGNWIMRDANITGSIRFAGAQIEGQVGFTQSRLHAAGDLAIRADGARIRGGWFMGRADIRGMVRLPSAELGNELRLSGTRIEVASGPALYANGATIARAVVLDGGFRTIGGIAFDHADIEGILSLEGSRIQSAALGRNGMLAPPTHDEVLAARYDLTAISLADASLERMVMPATADDRPRGIVDLSRATVGSYEDFAAAWPPPVHESNARGRDGNGRDIDHLVLDGFVYNHLEFPAGVPAEELARSRGRFGAASMRTRWLESQSSADLDLHFKPHAWLHLSRRLSAQGYNDDAREIAIKRRRRQRQSTSTSGSSKLQSWLLDVFALYGFNPWRTVTWIVSIILMFGAIWWVAAQACDRNDCKDEQVFVMALKGNFGQDDVKSERNYPSFSPLLFSADVFFPFVNFGYKEHWRPNTGFDPLGTIPLPISDDALLPGITVTAGGVLYGLYVLEMLLGLILTSLAVTGFAGLLKGDDEPR